ncbi:MAG TPA: D-alanyl-D-alanine carboxypeptidase/D-alanyl-D-alanine-endopeptidase [Longimicrobiales bacterium]|nr:D-alanyl-D-alanine carboxypeptidase/D-alanyl-D-alanine-endopeptidase [Longimicrobiales bacterium]
MARTTALIALALTGFAATAGVVAAPAAPAAPAAAVADARAQQLARDLAQVLRESGWPSDRWSVMVVSLDGGDTLFAHQPGADLTPASNLKLFTTAAALHYLGPSYRFSTYVVGTGAVRAGVLEGDLVLYGAGDPTMSGRFYQDETPVWQAVADSLAALGITRIAGDVVGDASYFEGPGVGSGWQASYITHTYAASASALSFNDNVATLRVTPAAAVGEPPQVQVLPAGHVEFRNDAMTVASGRTRIEVKRASYDAPLVLTGQIARGSAGVWRATPVADPAEFAASALAEVLRARGIEVTGGVRAIHDAATSPIGGRQVFAAALEDGGKPVQVLAVHQSPPLMEILKVINQRSHNLYADVVLRSVGRVVTGHGSVEGGKVALDALLGEQNTAARGVAMDDGSGLSIRNRASARSFIELLAFMESSPFRDQYLETLPEAAVDRGLRRMQQTAAAGNLRAKTGTIDNVSSLSGYVRAANGEMLAFAIISNDVPSTWRAKRIEDRIGARLASFDRPVPATRLARTAPAAAGEPTAAPEPAGQLPRTAAATQAAPDTSAALAPAPTEAAASEVAATSTYVVKSGDTLDAIARRNGISVVRLEAANPGVNPLRLMPGQELTIPGDRS